MRDRGNCEVRSAKTKRAAGQFGDHRRLSEKPSVQEGYFEMQDTEMAKEIKIGRRALLVGAGVTGAIATMGAAAPVVQPDKDAQLDALLFISRKLGLSVDDVHCWLKGVDMTIVAENVEGWTPGPKWGPSSTHAVFVAYAADVMAKDDNPTRDFLEAQLIAKGDRATIRKNLEIFGPEKHPHMAPLREHVAA